MYPAKNKTKSAGYYEIRFIGDGTINVIQRTYEPNPAKRRKARIRRQHRNKHIPQHYKTTNYVPRKR